MPNIRSAKKALRVSDRKRVFNDRRRKAMKGAIKDVEKLVKAKDLTSAKQKIADAYKAIDKATKRGVIKPNTASRKKARIARITKA
jgi:small subunit ribosomal protein S20